MGESTVEPGAVSKKRYYKTIDQQLMESGVLITNAVDPEVLELMKYSGYPVTAVKVGETLRTQAIAKINRVQKESGEQLGASKALETALDEMNRRYMPKVKLARILFEHNLAALEGLDLLGRRKSAQGGMIQQARLFYSNALANTTWLTQLASLGISEDQLQEDVTIVAEAEKALAIQQKETGESLTATVERDTALEQLFDWVNRYKKVAKVTLADYPRLMEKLGIKDSVN